MQQQPEGAHGKAVALLIEHHIEKGGGQYARGRRGTGGHCHFPDHQGCGLVAFFRPRTVVGIEQSQQAAPVELHLPAVTAIRGVQNQGIVADDPAIALIAKPDLHQIAGHRTVDLLPGTSRVGGALDQSVEADADQRIASPGDGQQGRWQTLVHPLRRHVQRIGGRRGCAISRHRQ
ncbi:hypothetical protein D3C84_777210 [compost metagenome]